MEYGTGSRHFVGICDSWLTWRGGGCSHINQVETNAKAPWLLGALPQDPSHDPRRRRRPDTPHLEPRRPLSRSRCAGGGARPQGRRRQGHRLPSAIRRQAGEPQRRGLPGRDPRLRADPGDPGPGDELRPAALCRRHVQHRDSAASSRTPTSARRRSRSRPCSSRWRSTSCPMPTCRRSWATRRCGAFAPWLRHRARLPPAPALRRAREDCCTRSTSPAAAPGCGCSTRPWPACASRVDGKELTSAEPATCCPTSDRRRARGGGRARSPRCSATTCGCSRWSPTRWPRTRRSRTSWRNSRARSPRATSPTRSRTRWSTRWSPRCKATYPQLSHRYYALKARWLGLEQLDYWDRNAPLPEDDDTRRSLGRGARSWCSTPTAPSRPSWPSIGRRFFDRPLDRRASCGPGKAQRRLRAPDRAERASLSAAELPGPHARRDDPGARAGPRRAPGAGGAAGPADGRHAADPGRDRLGVRRDADLPGAARRARPTRRGAASCSPARSRTC